MPISAPGISSSPRQIPQRFSGISMSRSRLRWFPSRSRDNGFTLIEVLVVLTIVGVTISGLTLGFNAVRERDADHALERLRWILEATAERAQTRGQPIAFELLSDGYRFSILDTDGKWLAFEEAPVFSEKLLPDSLHWEELRTLRGKTERLIFGNRSPRFELLVRTPDGIRQLSGQATGTVVLQRPQAASKS